MKTFIPSDFYSQDNLYEYNNGNIVVYSNCQNNSCNCNNIYTDLNYLNSNTYSCELQTSNNLINYDNLTDSYYYRVDYDKILIIFMILAFIIIICPIKIVGRFFKRVL